jgi:outer membrane protein OmpA-like peptidoglycan-associated protein
MLIRTSFAAAIIAVMAAPAIAGETFGEPIFSGAAGNAEPILVQDNGAGRGTVSPQRLRKPKVKKPVLPEAASPAATPSASQIERTLNAPASNAPRPRDRVTIREFKRRPELRRAAPSIDIQSINFAFGSAEIPYSQYGKVENIATALERLLRRRPNTQVLIEGHTDAVGSDYSNQILSEARASSLKRLLVREFGLPSYAMETVGYGERYLLVETPYEDWHNRRVTLRRIDEFVQ